MQYIKTIWHNNQSPALNADNLNHIEDGIEAATNATNDAVTALDGKLSNAEGAVKAENIDTGAVTEDKIANNSITDAKLIQVGGVLSNVSDINNRLDDFSKHAKNEFIELSGRHRNLFNLAAFTPDKEINSSGIIIDSGNHVGLTDYIPVISGETVYFSSDGSALSANKLYYIAVYDASKNFIQRVTAASAGYAYPVPSGVGFIRCVISNNLILKLKIEYGEITAFTRYVQVENIADNESTIINNAFNLCESVVNKNLFDSAQFIRDKEYTSTGTIIESANNIGYSNLIPVIRGQKLYFSRNGVGVSNYNVYYAIEFDNDKNFIRRISASTVNNYTPSDDAYYVKIEAKNAITYNLQVEYGAISPWNKYIDNKLLANHCLMANVNMFGSIAAVGDSYTAGTTISSGGTTANNPDQSYIGTMGRRAGVNWYNYGVAGATTRSYQTSSKGLPTVLEADPHDLYIFALGQNDINTSLTLGAIADINDADYTQNADTFYGNYGKIIQQIKNHAPKAKLIMVKSWIDGTSGTSGLYYQSYDSAIAEIASHYNIPCIAPFDDELFSAQIFRAYKNGGHPTTMGYSMMGLAMERLFSKCVLLNPNYFRYSVIG